MLEFFKPQSPLNKDGVYFYPLTTEDQVIMDDGSRLSSTLEDIKDKVDNIDFSNLDLEGVAYVGEYDGDVVTVALNADTLGGKTVDEFAQAPLRKSATILASGWSDSAPYTQIVSVEGVTVDDAPHISPVYSDDLVIAISQKEAWGMVSRAKTDENAITFICFEEKPSADIDVQIGVYR